MVWHLNQLSQAGCHWEWCSHMGRACAATCDPDLELYEQMWQGCELAESSNTDWCSWQDLPRTTIWIDALGKTSREQQYPTKSCPISKSGRLLILAVTTGTACDLSKTIFIYSLSRHWNKSRRWKFSFLLTSSRWCHRHPLVRNQMT